MARRVLAVCFVLAACGASPRPYTALGVPQDQRDRARVLRETGATILSVLQRGTPSTLLIDENDLPAIVEDSAVSRVSALRVPIRANRPDDYEALRGARFGGICLQDARLEPTDSPLELRKPSWVFHRALVMAVQPGGRRIASWVDGTFVYTTRGFAALDLERIEPPRWEHADLDVAPCDMQVGIR